MRVGGDAVGRVVGEVADEAAQLVAHQAPRGVVDAAAGLQAPG